MKSICSMENCSRVVEARGWCKAHYSKFWQQRMRLNQDGWPRCQIDGCENPKHVRGWCRLHYQRWARYGDPEKTLRDYIHQREGRLCLTCGNTLPKGEGRVRCNPCASKRNAPMRILYEERKLAGICVGCGDRPALAGRAKCSTCSVLQTAYAAKERAKRKVAGLCGACGGGDLLPALKDSAKNKRCEVCYMKELSRRYFNTNRRWQELKKKLENQGYLCPYTGTRLVLAVNDSLDHKMPCSRYPLLKTDMDNLEWVRRDINFIKSDKTPDEFLNLIGQIVSHRNDLWSRQPPDS